MPYLKDLQAASTTQRIALGAKIVAAAGRMFDKGTETYKFRKLGTSRSTVAVTDTGKVVTAEMTGDFLVYETDFVLEGGSIASSLADSLCWYVNRFDEKGILARLSSQQRPGAVSPGFSGRTSFSTGRNWVGTSGSVATADLG